MKILPSFDGTSAVCLLIILELHYICEQKKTGKARRDKEMTQRKIAGPLETYCNFLIWDQLFLILSTFHFA